jgi:Na+-driven multidrug efflux pump
LQFSFKTLLAEHKFFALLSTQDSPMRAPAEQFLTLRALGAPPIIVALAAQGAFRGFLDTRTPLYAVGKSLPVHFDKIM